MKNKFIKLLLVILLAVVAGVIASPKPTGWGWLDEQVGKLEVKLGLDLAGGVHLVYEADLSNIENGKESEALNGVQDVIESRVNAFGVAEPIVQTSKVGSSYRLIVELAGVKDIEEAKEMIKETPFLEFKKQGEPRTQEDLTEEEKELINSQADILAKQQEESKIKAEELLAKAKEGEDFGALARDNSQDPGSAEKDGDLDFFKKGMMVPEFEEAAFNEDLQNGQVYPELVKSQFGYHIIKKTEERGEGEEKEVRAAHILLKANDPEKMREALMSQLLQPQYEPTGLTGKELKRAQVDFDPNTGLPLVSIQFDNEGKEMFKQITEENVQKPIAIFLDNRMISAPIVQEVIRDGEAVINGDFNLDEAKKLSQRLNAGALPVPITLISQQSVEASLGQKSLDKSLEAGLIGLAAVGIFMILYYRLAGVVSVVALAIYAALLVTIFKVSSLSQAFGITLTLSGIAGFILSVGMAVDANILIFERMSEELGRGRGLKSALEEGFKRAWTSIRDGNVSTIITCVILIMFSSGFVKGFALILILGVLLSMFTAVVVTRILLSSVIMRWMEKHKWLVLGAKKAK